MSSNRKMTNAPCSDDVFPKQNSPLIANAMPETAETSIDALQSAYQPTAMTVVFVHVPKAAGTTLRNMLVHSQLQRNPEPWDISDRRELPDIGWQFTRHLSKIRRDTVGLIMGHMPHGMGELFENPVYVTILRDPIDRLISSYNYFLIQQESFAGETTGVAFDNILEFAWHPAFTNHQIQYFLNYDVENYTAFMAPFGTSVSALTFLGVSLGALRPAKLRKIKITQRRLGPTRFKVQFSNDEFENHIVDVASYCTASHLGRHIELTLSRNAGGTSWRVIPLTDAELQNWYVVSMELWEERDGCLSLVAGTVYSDDRFAPQVRRVWPDHAKPLCGQHTDNLVPEHAFDGKNALSLLDIDGTSLGELHLRQAKETLRKFSAIGIFEDLPPFIQQLAQVTGYSNLTMRRDNVGTKTITRNDIDPSIIEELKLLNRLDIEFYEYARLISREQFERAGIAYNADVYLGDPTSASI